MTRLLVGESGGAWAGQERAGAEAIPTNDEAIAGESAAETRGRRPSHWTDLRERQRRIGGERRGGRGEVGAWVGGECAHRLGGLGVNIRSSHGRAHDSREMFVEIAKCGARSHIGHASRLGTRPAWFEEAMKPNI